MVGVSAAIGGGGDTLEHRLKRHLAMDHHEVRMTRRDQELTLGCVGYPGYPTAIHETEEYWLCFEGELYDGLEPWTAEWLDTAQPTRGTDERYLERWLRETDGEFLLFVQEKATGRTAILNDALGRLPTYYRTDGDGVMVSRDLRLLATAAPAVDTLGLAQCLLLGYPLGARTVFEDVSRLRPASQLVVDPDQGVIDHTTITEFSFENPTRANHSLAENASHAVDCFLEACRNRASDDSPTLVSLSGGLDSRSSLAGMHRVGAEPIAATVRGSAFVPSADVETARSVAQGLDLEWEPYDLNGPTLVDRELLARIGTGHLGIATAFFVDYLRQVRRRHGSEITFVTGDGGDKLVPDLRPAVTEEADVLDQLVRHESICPLSQVTEMTGCSPWNLRDSIRERLTSYPETEPAAKYAHFMLYERGVNFTFEGEDRNRWFAWSTTPFYAQPVAASLINTPFEQKTRYGLYRAFLRELSPTAAAFPQPEYRLPVSSRFHVLAATLEDLVSRHLGTYEAVKPTIRSLTNLDVDDDLDPAVPERIRTQFLRSDVLGTVFDEAAVREFISSPEDADRFAVQRLLGLTMAIDDVISVPADVPALPAPGQVTAGE